MNLELENRRCLIAGGARGIGKAIAESFIAEGASVLILDQDPKTVEVCESLGPRAFGMTLDVCNRQLLDSTIDTWISKHGPIDHAVYAVGVGSGQFGFPYWNVDPDRWARVFEINLYGAVNLAHQLGPMMAERRSGTMTFLSSVAGQIGSQTDPPYSAAKAALINFVQCMAKDLAPFGVRVNTVCPGMIKTELNKSVWAAWAASQPPETWKDYDTWTTEKIAKVVPLQRWQTAEDIASMVVFLASRRAENITGQTLNVDGGFVMHS